MRVWGGSEEERRPGRKNKQSRERGGGPERYIDRLGQLKKRVAYNPEGEIPPRQQSTTVMGPI